MGLLGRRSETQAVASMLGGRLKVKRRKEAATQEEKGRAAS
jgi:hypothetical protein